MSTASMVLSYCAPEAEVLALQEQEALLQTSGLYENEPSSWEN